MKAEATVKFEFDSEQTLETVFNALKPETLSAPTERSRAHIEVDGKNLILKFEARDSTALRAALNSYLRWIKLIIEILVFLENA
ncbi:hypothetical protein DRO54_00545 [Candidatus Bathyarchaeota archaeon]|nr:MAG: hypothetical protein DRO54_00545 [Candidatus Bathyarchaeota archaeon]